ncbi:putative nuclease HARBI1 [Mercenaria mercenaria]|uniref:putative nuclease HARBI1 n=1 Tax=Mercenaria mercenaria TaxID=6596 RepID=UPI001E1D539D|nr:putative nuclease HARBI1 [Mercenaria mercenaria]
MDLADVKQAFFRKCNIPNTVGAVDGTLIPIIAPSQNEEVYVCRKNYHAINVQAVVDHRARFIDLVAKWPGSTHDASIFDNCGLKDHLERHELGHLLGDSGYPLRKYLITPVATPTTEKEVQFNQAHSSGRMVVERAFGMLKSRFRCLHRTGGVLYKRPGKSCQIVTACSRLHNFCLERNIPLPDINQVIVDRQEEVLANTADLNAVAYRQHLIERFG